jgi:hypothetical protein
MVRALSRPTTLRAVPADDFALADEEPAADRHEAAIDHPLSGEAAPAETGIVPEPRRHSFPGHEHIVATDDAATVAAEESVPIGVPTAGRARDVTMPPADPSGQLTAERPTRFTTLEEEQARRRAEHRRPWLIVAAQVGALVAVIGGFTAAVFYLSKPPSADDLYQAISAGIDSEEEASLLEVAREIDEFLQRYPDDARADELRQYQQRLDLDKLERKLYRQARLNGASDASLLPVEQLYLQAVHVAQRSPDEAVSLLQSLVDLYGPNQDDDANEEAAAVVQLAHRKLAALKAQIAEQRDRELASMTERLTAAKNLAETDPQQAAAMYRAIIDLHADDVWAAAVVDEARRQLAELNER